MAVARVPVPDTLELERTPRAPWAAAVADFCRQRPLGAVGGAVIVLMLMVAVAAPVRVRLHVELVPVQAPRHSLKVAPEAGVAVRVTEVPCV
uniref:Uncharacterized protein n=1 Tax=candidate division WOR-3 bacterium TaxID=2052148 RepID=A0A7C4GBY8_UNCW3